MAKPIGSDLGALVPVRSQARHSGLRICCCCSCGLVPQLGWDLIPDLEAPYATRWPPPPKKKPEGTVVVMDLMGTGPAGGSGNKCVCKQVCLCE